MCEAIGEERKRHERIREERRKENEKRGGEKSIMKWRGENGAEEMKYKDRKRRGN